MKLKEGKRKYFHFPIYNDLASLKLKVRKNNRIIFAGDDFITNHINDQVSTRKGKVTAINSDDIDHVCTNNVSSNAQTSKLTIESSNNEAIKVTRPTSKQIINVQKIDRKSINLPIKKRAFHHKESFTKNLEKDIAAKEREFRRDYLSELQRESSKTLKQQYSGNIDRFRSRMKKTPVLLSKKHEKSMFTKDELLHSMHKDLKSFILFAEGKLSTKLNSEQKMRRSLTTKPAVSQRKSGSALNDKQPRVLDRGLAGIFAEESKGIDKVKDKFFT
jgi:hypothetical protein